MEWILAPVFVILLAMVGLVFWLGRQLVLNRRSDTPKDTDEDSENPLG